MIEVRGLTKYYGNTAAIRQVNLSVQEGEIYGFLGENGAGKTTTIRIILGLVWPDEGAVLIRGRSVKPGCGKSLLGVGAILDEPRFYNHLSVEDNLRLLADLSGGASRKQVDEVLHLLGLEGMRRKAAGALSHGQRQRLGLAQALLPDNQILLLDEPQNGLDPSWIQKTRELLQQLAARGVTVLISSHRLNEIEQVCDRVGIIHRGQMLYEGSVAPLLEFTESITITLTDSRAQAAVEHLARQGTLAEPTSPCRLAIRTVRDEDIAGINRNLVQAGFGICEISRPRCTLEEVFLRLIADDGKFLEGVGIHSENP